HRDDHAAHGGADLGQLAAVLPQRLRQHPARRGRRPAALGDPRAERTDELVPLHFSLDSSLRRQSPRVGGTWWIPPQRATEARRRHRGCVRRKTVDRPAIAVWRASPMAPKFGFRVAPTEGGLAMDTRSLDRLGDEIAELSAHLDAATARLLDLIREFDAREGWNTGFRSCAAWLSWRVGLDLGAALEQALAAAREALYQGDVTAEPPTMAQQQADALALVAETALQHGIDPGAPGERYQVVVHVDAPALADPDQLGQSVLEDGAHVSAETSRRLACDASRVVMRHGRDGRVVEVAARTRTIPPA